jgi:hypothetical protein
MATNQTQIIIRSASGADGAQLEQLAALDGVSHAPTGSVLVAEAGGRIRAAYGSDTGRYIADPFWHSAELVELLRVHADAMAPRRSQTRLSRFARLATPALAGR